MPAKAPASATGAEAEVQRLRQYLKVIASLGGNLPDDRLTDATGPNDAAVRGLMYTTARQLATLALNDPSIPEVPHAE